MKVLIIADSRGRGLQQIIDNSYPLVGCQVIFHPGAGSELATLRSLVRIDTMRPDLIIMLTGVCDLTWRNSSTKIVGLRHGQVEENVQHVLQAMGSALDLIRAQGNYRVSIATLTGVDMADYNYHPRRHMSESEYLSYCECKKLPHCSQQILNKSILGINKRIVSLNKANSIQTVWVAGLVHSYYKGAYHHCYKRLSDGCHPSQRTSEAWVRQIIRSIDRILVSSA